MTPEVIWPIAAFAAIAIFKAGSVVEKMTNNKYVRKEVCGVLHVELAKQLDGLCADMRAVRTWMEAQTK